MILFLFLLLLTANSQWIDMPDCPYGTQYVGDVCQNDFGYTTCPVNYRFDSVQGKCVQNQAANSKCPNGLIEKVDEFGQITCEQGNHSYNEKQEDGSKNSPPNHKSNKLPPSKLKACRAQHSKTKSTCIPNAYIITSL